MQKTIHVNGMHCNSCISLITMEIEDAGGHVVDLDLKSGVGHVEGDITEADILAAVERVGYSARIVEA